MEYFKALIIIISALLHLVLYLVLLILSGLPPAPDIKEPPKQWLVFEDPKNNPSMAEATKRVEKETRTKLTSPAAVSALQPENSNNSVLRPSLKELQQQQSSAEKSSDHQLQEALRTSTDSDLFMNQSAQVSSSQRQQLQSFLPQDLELGDMVALNTDQNLFFTFYRRMAEKIIWPWAQSVSASFEKLRAQGQLGSTGKAWVTIVEVVLDKNGNVVATQPLQLAGEWSIDSAPTNAFKSAKNFPNPPVEMIEEDGYIRIRYKFVVYYNPSNRQ